LRTQRAVSVVIIGTALASLAAFVWSASAAAAPGRPSPLDGMNGPMDGPAFKLPENLIPVKSEKEIKTVRIRVDGTIDQEKMQLAVVRAVLREAGLKVVENLTDPAHAEIRLSSKDDRRTGGREAFFGGGSGVGGFFALGNGMGNRTKLNPPAPIKFHEPTRPDPTATPTSSLGVYFRCESDFRYDDPSLIRRLVRNTYARGALIYKTADKTADSIEFIDSVLAAVVADALAPTAGKKPEDLLLSLLADKDPVIRAFAAGGLTRTEDKRAVTALVKAVDDDSPLVRMSAVQALGWLEEQGLDPLTTVLKNKDPAIRAKAAGLIGGIYCQNVAPAILPPGVPASLKDHPSVNALVTAIEDPVPNVRRASAMALGYTRDARGGRPLIAHLKDRDAGVREAAAGALQAIHPPEAAAPLAEALGDECVWVRINARDALMNVGEKDAAPALIAVLKSASDEARARAASLLCEFKAAAAADPLLPLLADPSWKVRVMAAQALAVVGKDTAIAPLTKTLQDPDPRVRQAAARALGYLAKGKAEVAAALKPLLEDVDFYVRYAAAWATDECRGLKEGDKPTNLAVEPTPAQKDALAKAIKNPTPEVVPLLITALEGRDIVTLRNAARALGKLKAVRAIDPLVAFLGSDRHDADELDAEAAARALGEIGSPEALPFLEAALKRANTDGRTGFAAILKKAIEQCRAAKP
jgi:HEAT repeat protein